MKRRSMQTRRTNRRRLRTELLEDRRLLATLDLLPNLAGTTTTEEGTDTVVVVTAGSTTRIRTEVNTSETPVQTFQLNFSRSNAGLVINTFTIANPPFNFPFNSGLNSTAGDFTVGGGFADDMGPDELPVPPIRVFGTFDVTVPTAPGDYRLTQEFTTGNENTNTALSDAAGQPIPITSFGDLILRVEGSTNLPKVNFTNVTDTLGENAGVVMLRVDLSAASATDVSIPFTTSGTATSGTDFTISASPLVIPAGSTSGMISVTVTDDTVADGTASETIIVTLGNPTGAQLDARSVFTLNIVDNDLTGAATLDLVPTTGTVTTENGRSVITVTPGTTVNVRSEVPSAARGVQTFQLNFSNSDPALVLNTFVIANPPFNFPFNAGLNSAAGDFLVGGGFADDMGPDELPVPPTRAFGTFNVVAPTAPGDYRLTQNFTTGTETTNTSLGDVNGTPLNITDFGDLIIRVMGDTPPPGPVVKFTTVTDTLGENAGVVMLRVDLSATSTTAVTIPFTTSGTATLGTDFTIATSPLVIPAGSTSGTIAVTVIDDTAIETPPTETIVVTLGTPSGATLDAASVFTLNVVDNDVPAGTAATLDLVPTTGTVTTENGRSVITVTPGTTVNVRSEVPSAARGVQTFQLNFSNSDPALVLNTFVIANPPFNFPFNAGLNSAAGDFLVGGGFADDMGPDELPVPPTRPFGTFNVIAPTTPGDYRLTQNFTTGTETTNTSLGDVNGTPLNITDFGDLIIRVSAPPVPTVTLGATPINVTEGAASNTVTLTATLSAAATSAISIPYTVTGTATTGTDFTVAPAAFNFAVGATTATITVTVIDDTLDEPETPETVIVTLNPAATVATLGANASQTVNIVDNDPVTVVPTVTLGANPINITEGATANTVTLTATLSAAATAATTIPYTITGTATTGTDFTATPAAFNFAAGATTATITITVIDDQLDEPVTPETIIVTLNPAAGVATLGANASQTVNIVDNDPVAVVPTVTLGANPINITEGATANTVTLTATLSSAATAATTVPYTITGTATTGTDFTVTPAAFNFAVGATTATITITVIDDQLDEPETPETVIVTLNPAATVATLGANASQTVNIVDNDPVGVIPTVTLGANPINITEGATANTVTLTATLSAAATAATTIPYTITGTATSGTDFTVAPAAFNFAVGATTATITVTVIDDLIDEPAAPETVIVTLNPAAGVATLGANASQTVNISDNDPVDQTPTVTLGVGNLTVTEGGSRVVTATLSAAATTALSIPYTISGTATNGTDFTVTPATFNFAVGATTATITVNTIDDAVIEATETVIVTLGTATGVNPGTNLSQTVQIVDNDAPLGNRIVSLGVASGVAVAPNDGLPTAIIFKAEVNSTLTVGEVGVSSFSDNLRLLDGDLNPVSGIGGRNANGVFQAELTAGQMYGLIINSSRVDDQGTIVFLRSSAGPGGISGENTTNLFNRSDVNGNGVATAEDALMVINQLNRQLVGEGEQAAPGSQAAGFYDVNGDGTISAADALEIIHELARDMAGGEGEQIVGATATTSGSSDSLSTLGDSESVDETTQMAAQSPTSTSERKPILVVNVDSSEGSVAENVDELLSDSSFLGELLLG